MEQRHLATRTGPAMKVPRALEHARPASQVGQVRTATPSAPEGRRLRVAAAGPVMKVHQVMDHAWAATRVGPQLTAQWNVREAPMIHVAV